MLETTSTIIPIASGKGGVGKSFFTANLAIALAEKGNPTIAVDMDLGGSNLHSLLGFANRFPGIGDFLRARSAELEELLVPAKIDNLQFLPGDVRTPFMANIPYAQKIRLISRIKKLPAKYILLDLGSGTSFNTLDFFTLSPHGLLVTTPEYPTAMNMLVFLKHSLLRAIERGFTKDRELLSLVRSLYKLPTTDQQLTIEEVRSRVAALDRDAGKTITALSKKYRPRVVFNMGEHPDEIKVAKQISKSLKDVLSLEADYFGFIFADSKVRRSVKKGKAFLPTYRESLVTKIIVKVAERIVKFWERPIEKSAQRLFKQTKRVYEDFAA